VIVQRKKGIVHGSITSGAGGHETDKVVLKLFFLAFATL